MQWVSEFQLLYFDVLPYHLLILINELIHRITEIENSHKITQAMKIAISFLKNTLTKIMFVNAKMIDIPGPFGTCVLQ